MKKKDGRNLYVFMELPRWKEADNPFLNKMSDRGPLSQQPGRSNQCSSLARPSPRHSSGWSHGREDVHGWWRSQSEVGGDLVGGVRWEVQSDAKEVEGKGNASGSGD